MHVVLYKILVCYRMFSSIRTLYCIPSFALNNIIFAFLQYSSGQNTKTLTLFNKRHKLIHVCCFHGEQRKRQDLKQMRGSGILATRNHRIFTIQSTFFKPHNKLEMKTQKKADATYKSTKNIQRARSGDNLSSTTGTDERAAPRTTVVTPKCHLVPALH